MYLLKLGDSLSEIASGLNSHSTMYLLKRFIPFSNLIPLAGFTFHHVSIKTVIKWEKDINI